jgi:hypothetical protein
MEEKLKVGDKVMILNNKLPSKFVGKIGVIVKVHKVSYPDSDSIEAYGKAYSEGYRVAVTGKVLKGIAFPPDLKLVKQ